MGKVYYVNGGIFATTGNLYTRNIYAGDSFCPDGAIVLTPPDGAIEITRNTGSIFDTYHVRDYVTAGGIDVGNIFAFKDLYSFTASSYRQNRDLLKSLLSLTPASPQQKNLYYQQLFAHIFSLFEKFLCDTFVRQTCDREASYHRVLDSNILIDKRVVRLKPDIRILTGDDSLKKELLYIQSVKGIVYHRLDLVASLFSTAFGIQLDLSLLNNDLDIRNDIIHRFGYSDKGVQRVLSEENVIVLLEKVDAIVESIIQQIESTLSTDD